MRPSFHIPLWLEGGAALMVAMLFAVVSTLIVFQIDEQSQRSKAGGDILNDRVAATVLLLREAPPSFRKSVVDSMSRPTRYLTVDAAPIITAEMPRDRKAEQTLRKMIADAQEGSVLVHLPNAQDAAAAEREPRMIGPEPVGPVASLISAKIREGEWLNVRYRPIEVPARVGPAIVAGMIAVAVMIIAAFWMRARFAKPLQALAAAAVALQRGEPSHEIPERGPEAMRAAAQAFNAMSQRLTAMLEHQRTIMTSVAHDLRTPISSLRLRAELVKDPDERQRLLQGLDDLQNMAEAVLSAASADRTGEAARPVDLKALLESLIDDMQELNANVTTSSMPAQAQRCICRTTEVRRAVRNLIENALRYGDGARVSLAFEHKQALITIDDDGPGIPRHELQRVFEPFARLEQSRSAQTGGYGLGLSIARWIARGHGGDVTLCNRPEGGLRAQLTLPVEPLKAQNPRELAIVNGSGIVRA